MLINVMFFHPQREFIRTDSYRQSLFTGHANVVLGTFNVTDRTSLSFDG